MVGTFHTYSTSRLANGIAENAAAPAPVREAEGRHRGLRGRALDRPALLRRPLSDRAQRRGPRRRPARSAAPPPDLRLLFVGRAEERKGLPVLLRAFKALRGAGVEARLTVAGANRRAR